MLQQNEMIIALTLQELNEDKSAAIFCHQVAALVPRYVLQVLFCKKSQNG